MRTQLVDNLRKDLLQLVCSSQSLTTQQLRREGLISHFHTLKTLLHQGVPIKRNTDLESNIYQFDLDKARGDKGLKLLLYEKHGQDCYMQKYSCSF